MAQPIQMLLCGIPNALKFDGKSPSELPWYLENIEYLGDTAVLNEARKIKVVLHYAALDKVELWQTLPEATAIPADWHAFITAVKKIYSGCEGTNQYCWADI